MIIPTAFIFRLRWRHSRHSAIHSWVLKLCHKAQYKFAMQPLFIDPAYATALICFKRKWLFKIKSHNKPASARIYSTILLCTCTGGAGRIWKLDASKKACGSRVVWTLQCCSRFESKPLFAGQAFSRRGCCASIYHQCAVRSDSLNCPWEPDQDNILWYYTSSDTGKAVPATQNLIGFHHAMRTVRIPGSRHVH